MSQEIITNNLLSLVIRIQSNFIYMALFIQFSAIQSALQIIEKLIVRHDKCKQYKWLKLI